MFIGLVCLSPMSKLEGWMVHSLPSGPPSPASPKCRRDCSHSHTGFTPSSTSSRSMAASSYSRTSRPRPAPTSRQQSFLLTMRCTTRPPARARGEFFSSESSALRIDWPRSEKMTACIFEASSDLS